MIRARTLSLTFAVITGMTLAAPATAQDAPFRQLIVEQWSLFTTFCTPFMQDPNAAMAALPMDVDNLIVSSTPDGTWREYTQASPGYSDGKSAFLQKANGMTTLQCNTHVSLEGAFGQPIALNQAFVDILDQTDGVSYAGGMVEYERADPLQANLPAAQKIRASYFINGVFPGEFTSVNAEVSYFMLAFSVAAHFDAEKGIR